MLLPIRSVVLTVHIDTPNLDDFRMLTSMFAVSLNNLRIHLHDWVKLVLFTHIPKLIDLLGFQLFRNYAVWRLDGLVVYVGRLGLL